jgi:integrase
LPGHQAQQAAQAHECLLSVEELARLGQAGTSPNPQEVAALRLIILTGCRKSEICHLTWDEVRGRRLLLHDAKTGPRTVWLGREAQSILKRIERHPMRDEVFWTEGGRHQSNDWMLLLARACRRWTGSCPTA